jgi:hypothetical protein
MVGWFGSGWLTGSSWFGLWHAAVAKPVCMVLSLAIGGMPVSSISFAYRWDACERWLVWLHV